MIGEIRIVRLDELSLGIIGEIGIEITSGL
jgi:hypothetical protein